ncbi:MAG: VOC family protein, partial [Bacteroidota bacterium]
LNLETASGFYRDIIGLREILREGRTVRLSANGKEPALIVLEGDPGALPRPVMAPGLFHTALLFPNRLELARTMRHVGEMGWKFQGFADHGVSEAVYLADAEGNGLELYRDRPRNEWPIGSSVDSSKDPNEVTMVTEPLDIAGLIAELADVPPSYEGIHPDAIVGHIHLQVSSLDKAKTFYHDLLGLEITQQTYPGALFLSADGYHHHVGLNVWNSLGVQLASVNSTGLISFGVQTISSRFEGIVERADAKDTPLSRIDRLTCQLKDPDEISLDLSVFQKKTASVR